MYLVADLYPLGGPESEALNMLAQYNKICQTKIEGESEARSTQHGNNTLRNIYLVSIQLTITRRRVHFSANRAATGFGVVRNAWERHLTSG
jgi:hypothetical protein